MSRATLISALLVTIFLCGCVIVKKTSTYSTRVEQPTAAIHSVEFDVAPSPFLEDIRRFEQEDSNLKPSPDRVIFVGSTTIAGWSNLQKNFTGIDVINRGIQGSALLDVIRYADRIILKYQPRVVVVYGGESDIATLGSECHDVHRHLTTLVDLIHRQFPETKILYVSLKPSPERSHCLDQIVRANRLIREFAEDKKYFVFIDTIESMLDDRGNVRSELFAEDGVQLSQQGYDVWAEAMRPHIEAALKRD